MLARMRVARGQPLWRRQVPLLFQGDFLGKCRWNHHSLVPFGNGESVATLQLGSYDDSSATPPLVLLGGTAQTINGWVGHHKQLSADRQFLQYELRGQGRTTLNLSDCSLKQHIADFEELVTRQLQIPTPVDLVRSNPMHLARSTSLTLPFFKNEHACDALVDVDVNRLGLVLADAWLSPLPLNDRILCTDSC